MSLEGELRFFRPCKFRCMQAKPRPGKMPGFQKRMQFCVVVDCVGEPGLDSQQGISTQQQTTCIRSGGECEHSCYVFVDVVLILTCLAHLPSNL